MRFLVTGGAGFIGSHLIEKLLKRGDEVVCLDDFNSFYNPEYKRENMAPFLQQKHFSLIEGDLRDQAKLQEAFEGKPIDQVVHLAARAGVRPSLKEPQLYVDVNVNGTLLLLEKMREFGVKKMVFASSSSVYGVNSKLPFQEEDPLLTPISPYAATKIAGEVLCRTYAHLYDIASVCLRFFTVYGPRQRPEMAIYKFTRAILNGEEVSLYGEGDSSRDYTFIDDIVEGLVQSIAYSPKGVEIFNLGESQPIALKDLITTLEKVIGKKANIKILSQQAGDVPATYADITRAKKKLGYHPSVPLAKGLESFVSWYKSTRA